MQTVNVFFPHFHMEARSTTPMDEMAQKVDVRKCDYWCQRDVVVFLKQSPITNHLLSMKFADEITLPHRSVIFITKL